MHSPAPDLAAGIPAAVLSGGRRIRGALEGGVWRADLAALGVGMSHLAIERGTLRKFCKSMHTQGNQPQKRLITSALCIRLAECAMDVRE